MHIYKPITEERVFIFQLRLLQTQRIKFVVKFYDEIN